MALLKAAVADGVRTRTELRSVRKDGGLSETCTGLGPPEPFGSTPRIGPSAWDARGRSELISHLEHHLSTPGIGVISHSGGMPWQPSRR